MAFGDRPLSRERIHTLVPEMIKGTVKPSSETDHGAHILATERALKNHFNPQIDKDDKLPAGSDREAAWDSDGNGLKRVRQTIRAALVHYSSSDGARDLNAKLRGGYSRWKNPEDGRNSGPSEHDPSHKDRVLRVKRNMAQFHRAFSGGLDTRLPIHTDSFHGLGGEKSIVGGLLPGNVMRVSGMLSSSIDARVAFEFATHVNHTTIDLDNKGTPDKRTTSAEMLHIHHPKGSTSSIYLGGDNTSHPGEREMVTNHDSHLLFTGRSHLVFPHKDLYSPLSGIVIPHHITIHHFEALK